MSSAPFVDYYKILGVDANATAEQIREAYRKESLRCHPDRFPKATQTERERHTARFQSLADAYYVLSDAGRRASYDTQRKAQQSSSAGFPPGGFDFFGPDGSDPAKEQWSSASFFNHFFGGAGSSSSSSSSGSRQHQETAADETEAAHENGQPNASGIFGSVFEELLRPEVQRVAPIWTWVGSASGAGLGFILGSIPGAIAGTVLGNRLGAIRDAKGKSVAAVFAGLGADQKAEVLRALAMKVLGSMAGGSSGRG